MPNIQKTSRKQYMTRTLQFRKIPNKEPESDRLWWLGHLEKM